MDVNVDGVHGEWLQVTGYRLQVTGYRLQVAGCGFAVCKRVGKLGPLAYTFLFLRSFRATRPVK
jgi:hypothetical protein